MTVHVVGVSGKGGSGKNTLTDYIRARLTQMEIENREIALATPVKDFGTQYFGKICDPVVKDPVSRLVLQGIGQMMRQEVRDDFWIQKARESVTLLADNKFHSPSTNIVIFITDVRYRNEANALVDPAQSFYLGEKPSESHLLRINGRTSLTGTAAEHPSEVDLDDYTNFTYVYNNVGTLQDLYGFGDAFIERIFE